MNCICNNPEAHVYVIYTGGTIGMMRDDNNVLVFKPNELPKRMKQCPDFHDEQFALQKYGSDNDMLVLPAVEHVKSRVFYQLKEYSSLMDSCNMTMKDWKQIAEDIELVYRQYNGFVILHGTDTLAFTASALSFMLENLGKPVIVTGAQLPIFDTLTDGKDNFLSSLLIAGNYDIPEVCVFFGHKLLRGNRTTKVDSEGFSAFESYNAPPIANVGIDIKYDSRNIFRPNTIESFQVQTNLQENISILRLFPSISMAAVRATLQPPIKGVILQSFGAGNIPSNRNDILKELIEAVRRGVIIVNTTQCHNGRVMPIYETDSALAETGVLPGYDMTQEAALGKLAYVLGNDKWDLDKKKEIMVSNIRGELTSVDNSKEKKFKLALISALNLNTPNELEKITTAIFPALVIAAVMEDNLEKLNDLKESGVDLCCSNFDGRSALHLASDVGNVEMVSFLLENGCSVHAKDRFSRTPLHEAIDADNHDIIKLLMKAGAHLLDNPQTLADVMCALAERGAINRIKSYHLAGANITSPDRTGRTTLHVAAELGYVDLVKYLLPHFRDKNIRDALGNTPLDYAIQAGQSDILPLLSTNK